MQKLIIIRGHSGSGKSTFAKQKIMEFVQCYPQSKIFHIENDHFLYENEIYIWTEQRFQIAKRKSAEKLQKAWEYVRNNPDKAVLIINSNVNAIKQAVEKSLNIANALNMNVEIYRMMNLFENTHNVSDETVRSMFETLENNPIQGEIRVWFTEK